MFDVGLSRTGLVEAPAQRVRRQLESRRPIRDGPEPVGLVTTVGSEEIVDSMHSPTQFVGRHARQTPAAGGVRSTCNPWQTGAMTETGASR